MKIGSKKQNDGLALVEVIIATSIILIFLVSLVGAYTIYLKISLENTQKVQAAFLAEEGIEAVKMMRDVSWDDNIATLIPGTDYYLSWNGHNWATTTLPSMIDSTFLRTVRFFEVYRDAGSDIVDVGGTFDPNTIKVIVTVAWSRNNATSTRTIETYLTNIFSN